MEIADPTTLYKVLYTVATNKCKNIITGRYMFDRYADVHCKKDILLNCKFKVDWAERNTVVMKNILI